MLDDTVPMRLLIAYTLILLIAIAGITWTTVAVRRHRRKQQKLAGYRR